VARKRKRNRVKNLIVLILTPLTVWGLAFLLWFYWYDLKRWNADAGKEPKPVAKSARKVAPKQPSVKEPSGEKILEEDRKTLEGILKERSK
jgi:hypothetical protein